MITDQEAEQINQSNPALQSAKAGDKIKELFTGAPIFIDVEITADATSGQSVTIPYNFKLRDVIVQCTAANASGSATVRSGANAISDAIAMAVDTTITRAGTLDDTYTTITTFDSINVITNGAGDRGIVTLVGVRS